jgi:3-oxoacyl-[acyl-carrier protein] reductase
MPDELQNRFALVTGGTRGIGRAIAVALAHGGADVAVNYLSRDAAAQETCEAIKRRGRRAIALRGDVSQASAVRGMVRRVNDELGAVAILVNNAGVTRPQSLKAISEADWDEILAVNLKSMFLVTQAVLPGMFATAWGRNINLSSVAAQLGGVVGPHYAASKAGAIGLTHSDAHLLAEKGITVNAVAPALVETETVAGNPNARPDLIPVGRFGHVEETASVVVMLAQNGYITGQTINVNGGWYMS